MPGKWSGVRSVLWLWYCLIAAEKLDRKWIGIDITYLAVDVLKQRIEKDFGSVEDVDFEVIGKPKGMAGAKKLAEDDKSEFQKWIISLSDV